MSKFFSAVEAKDYTQAFGIWNNDPNWQQHPNQYQTYPYKTFMSDWGPSGEYGVIEAPKFGLQRIWKWSCNRRSDQ